MVSYPPKTQVLLDNQQVAQLFEIFRARTPRPQTELQYTTPYTMLVAVVLSAQCTDAAVNKATKDLFKNADTPQKMLALGLEQLKVHIRSIGLYNNKAKNIISLSQILVESYGGDIPQSVAELESLPGVGRKTANVVANVLWGLPTMPVDTHVFRVANRMGLCQTKTPQSTESALLAIIPSEFLIHAHHWLILHGRYVCKARKPDCASCPVSHICLYKDKVFS